MGEASALSALGVTIILALSRPALGVLVVGPALAAIAGITLMTAAGHVAILDIIEAIGVLWRPMIAIASIMVIAIVAAVPTTASAASTVASRLSDPSVRSRRLQPPAPRIPVPRADSAMRAPLPKSSQSSPKRASPAPRARAAPT